MLIGDYTNVFFLGIGGIGMSALARWFVARHYTVAGYDRTPSQLTDELKKEGISITYDESIDALPACFSDSIHTLVVRTPAVPADQQQLQYFSKHGFTIMKRSEVLGELTRQMRSLCVAGTHGKTTTSTILAHLMYQSDISCNAFLGGISNNYGTNMLLSPDSNYVVVEADEYDRSFHQLTPYMSILTSADPDHLDIYGDKAGFREGFEHYTSLIKKGGALIIKQGTDITPRLQTTVKLFTYTGILPDEAEDKPDFYATNVIVKNSQIWFDFVTPRTTIQHLKLGVPVYVNIENSVAAMAVAWLNGVNETELRLRLASFTGVYRRFNILVSKPDIVYIDDYAHHPTELQTSLDSIRRIYPDQPLTAIFQPHLYSRTRDFADGFARVLSNADRVILLPIYPAREEPIEGVSSEMLLSRISCADKYLMSKTELLEWIQSNRQQGVVATLGAGDIDRLVPQIKKILTSQ